MEHAHGDIHGRLGDVIIEADSHAGSGESSAQAAPTLLRRGYLCAEQDLAVVCIPRAGAAKGLFSKGFSCCTAIILRSPHAIGLMHASDSGDELAVTIREAVARFREVSATPPHITLGTHFKEILRSLEAGEAWEDHHDADLARTDRDRYVRENAARLGRDLKALATRFGADLLELADGAVSVDCAGRIRADEPGDSEFRVRDQK